MCMRASWGFLGRGVARLCYVVMPGTRRTASDHGWGADVFAFVCLLGWKGTGNVRRDLEGQYMQTLHCRHAISIGVDRAMV
jgi:hypothetical protein